MEQDKRISFLEIIQEKLKLGKKEEVFQLLQAIRTTVIRVELLQEREDGYLLKETYLITDDDVKQELYLVVVVLFNDLEEKEELMDMYITKFKQF